MGSCSLWFPKIRSGRIRAVRENQTIIQCDICDHLPRAGGSKGWGIFYNNAIASEGRINFTLGHEFGHLCVPKTQIRTYW